MTRASVSEDTVPSFSDPIVQQSHRLSLEEVAHDAEW